MASKKTDTIKGVAIVGAFVLIFPTLVYYSVSNAGNADDRSVVDIADSLSDSDRLDARGQKVEIKDHYIDELLAEHDVKENTPLQIGVAEIADQAGESKKDEASQRPAPQSVEVTPKEEGTPSDVSHKENCRPYEIQQNLRGCGTQLASYTAKIPSPEHQAAPPPSSPIPESNAGGGSKHPALIWKELVGKRSEPIIGRQNTYAGDAVKAGCRVIAVMDEQELRIPSGYKHSITLNVRMPVDDCILPEVDGIRITGDLEYAPGEGGLIGGINRCSDRNPRRKSVDCKGKGKIQSITGSEVIEAIIYDNSNWGLLFESLVSIGLTPSIAKLTETASTAKTIFQATSSEMIAATMTKTLDRVGQKIGAAFDDKEMRLSRTCKIQGEPKPCPVFFIVSFSDDVIL